MQQEELHSRGKSEGQVSPERGRILNSLLRFGNIFELDFYINSTNMDNELKRFASNWAQYNPYKPENPRQGLSVTSLDGSLNGKPDLYSLGEIYEREGKHYLESDFRTLTSVYKECPQLQPIINHFYHHLGRCHFLRLLPGGYFPPHRDGVGLDDPDCFRILVPLQGTSRTNFVFLYEDERVVLECGTAYFMNTLVSHSLFAFSQPATLLVMNVLINEESLELIKSTLAHR